MYKLLIVDDEPFVRSGIRKLTDQLHNWEVEGEAGNGHQAMAFLERKPVDLVLCDIRMPDCDGMALIERLRDQGNDIPIVFLTGHPDFDYAQKALRYGALDYLLKPCLAQDIRAVLEKAETLLEERKIRLQYDEYARETAVRSWLHGEKRYEQLNADLLGWFRYASSYRIISLNVAKLSHEGNTTPLERIQAWTSAGHRMLLQDGPREYVVLSVDDPVGDKAIGVICRQSEGRMTAGIGDAVLASELDRSYRQSKLALGLTNETRPVVSYQELVQGGDFQVAKTVEKEMELLQAVKSGKAEGAEDCLQELSGMITTWPLLELRRYLYTLYNQLLLGSVLSPDRADLPEPLRLLEEDDNGGMLHLFSTFVGCLCEQVRQQTAADTHYTVQRTIRTIHERFRDNLTLKDIAAELRVSPAYLSVLFKQETRQTFSEYLISIRIKEAQRRMRETTMKIYEIAQEVGYVDGRHFSQVFKQTTGLTPQEYRHRHPG